jgi:hypothetical protein
MFGMASCPSNCSSEVRMAALACTCSVAVTCTSLMLMSADLFHCSVVSCQERPSPLRDLGPTGGRKQPWNTRRANDVHAGAEMDCYVSI